MIRVIQASKLQSIMFTSFYLTHTYIRPVSTMCRLLWEPLCLLPDAGPAPSSSRGCKNLDQPRANLWEGLDPAGTLLCASWGHCHCKAGAHQAWRTRRRKPHRAEECWGMYVSSKHVLTISSSVLSTTSRFGERAYFIFQRLWIVWRRTASRRTRRPTTDAPSIASTRPSRLPPTLSCSKPPGLSAWPSLAATQRWIIIAYKVPPPSFL